jgi:hypothetical protein
MNRNNHLFVAALALVLAMANTVSAWQDAVALGEGDLATLFGVVSGTLGISFLVAFVPLVALGWFAAGAFAAWNLLLDSDVLKTSARFLGLWALVSV